MISAVLAVTLALYAPQREASTPLEPALEARVQKLGKELRCAVCQGLSITDSPASMARAQLDTVRDLVSEGKSDAEIREYFIARYGEWVLLDPKKEGLNWLVWAGPLALVAIGLLVIARQIGKPAPAAPAPQAPAGRGPARERRPLPRPGAPGGGAVTPETHWLPGLLVLGGALLIGVVYLLLTRHRNQRLADREEQQTELDRKAQLYLDQLRELNQEQHHLSPEQYQAEKSRLELLAAAALRSRDEHRQRPVAPGSDSTPPTSAAAAQATPRPAGFFDRNPQLKGALWGAGVVLFFVMIGIWLSQAEKPRQGGEATGKDPSAMGANVAPMVDDEREQGFQRALTRANEHPDDVDLSASVVHELIRREDWPKAIALTDRSLGVDPFHPEHRIHRALFRASRGRSTRRSPSCSSSR